MIYRPCLERGCSRPVVYRGYCAQHRRQGHHRTRPKSRIYGLKRWQTTRRAQLTRQPLCERCGQLAANVHHKVDLADGGDPWDPIGLESLCTPCHSALTRSRADRPTSRDHTP